MTAFLKDWPFDRRMRLLGAYFLIYVALLTVNRLIFTLAYAYRLEDEPFTNVLLAFAIGLRFDGSAAATLIAPFFLLASVNFLNRFAVYRSVWSFGPIVVLVGVIALCVADLIYYENGNKHIGYEAFAFLGDIGLLFGSALSQDPLRVVGGLLALGLVIGGAVYLYARYVRTEYVPERIGKGIGRFVVLTLLLIIAFRSGLQERIMRAGEAIISQNDFLNNVGLNPVFTTVADLRSFSVPDYQTMPLDEAVYLVRRELDYEGASFVSDEYPLLRKTATTRNGRPPNIVLILMENWTGKFIKPIGGGMVDGKEVTPRFNQLANEGVFFRNFVATGGRTTSGLLATLTGMPEKPGLTVFRTHHVVGTFRGLPEILRELGYHTLFVTGGPLEFTNKINILPQWGFTEVLGRRHMAKMGDYEADAWGYYDEDIFRVFRDRLSALHAENPDRPFFAVAESLTTHYPYELPHERFAIFDDSTRDYEFLNVYHYSDWALGELMDRLRTEPYFDDTLFVIMADHTHHRYLNYYEDRQIPALFYQPSRLRPEVREQIATQTDLIPTLLSMVGKETYFSAMGRDLFAPDISESAYFVHGNYFGWIEKDIFYYQLTDALFGVGYKPDETDFEKPPCVSERGDCDVYQRKSLAFLNASNRLIDANRVYPPATTDGPEPVAAKDLERTGCPVHSGILERDLEARALAFEAVREAARSPWIPRATVINQMLTYIPPTKSARRETAAAYYDSQYFKDARARRPVRPTRREEQGVGAEQRSDVGVHLLKMAPDYRSAEVIMRIETIIENPEALALVREREQAMLERAAQRKADDASTDDGSESAKTPMVHQDVRMGLSRWKRHDCRWYPDLPVGKNTQAGKPSGPRP